VNRLKAFFVKGAEWVLPTPAHPSGEFSLRDFVAGIKATLATYGPVGALAFIVSYASPYLAELTSIPAVQWAFIIAGTFATRLLALKVAPKQAPAK
jgi:Zn-dependent protease